MAIQPGQRIGSYIVVRLLGAGGMGRVYLAEHRTIARQAAIKVLREDLSARGDVLRRFFAEARAASLVKHPGVIEVLDCDVDQEGRAFIVMELLQGESLQGLLSRVGRLPDPGMAFAILREIASALAATHAAGIVHRDLKPANIFLSEQGPDRAQVKVLDFGVAKLATPLTGIDTREGSLIGTPSHMSPEQCRGAAEIDHRSDIYSLGCIGFELIAGRPPFVKDGVGELIVAHVSEAPPPLSSLVSVAENHARLIHALLEKDPARRPQSMLEVVAMLDQVLGDPSGMATSSSIVPRGAHVLAADRPARAIIPVAAPALRTPVVEGSPPAVASGTRLYDDSRTTFTNTASERTGPERTRRATGLLVVSAGAAVAMVAFLVLALRPPPPPQTARTSLPIPAPSQPRRVEVPPPSALPSSATEPDQAPSRPVPRKINVQIASRPAGAKVSLADGTPLGTTPLSLSVPGSAEARSLMLRLKGYRSKTVTVTPKRDLSFDVTLERVRPQPSRRSTSTDDARPYLKIED